MVTLQSAVCRFKTPLRTLDKAVVKFVLAAHCMPTLTRPVWSRQQPHALIAGHTQLLLIAIVEVVLYCIYLARSRKKIRKHVIGHCNYFFSVDLVILTLFLPYDITLQIKILFELYNDFCTYVLLSVMTATKSLVKRASHARVLPAYADVCFLWKFVRYEVTLLVE